LVGRPNAGKSTLTNALVGAKIAITSSRPQTTRHAVRGLVHRPDAQLVLVDTPGLHKPRTLLGERLNDLVRSTWTEVDVIGVCLPCDQRIGPGDRYLVGEVARLRRRPLFAVATKSDTVRPERMAEHLTAVARLAEITGVDWAEVVPVSAVTGDRVELLTDLLVAQLPPGPALYPDGELTDEPEQTLVGELIREAALEGVRDELPHSIAVVVEEMAPREDRPPDRPLVDIRARVYVERDSQKGIVIGHRGVSGSPRQGRQGLAARSPPAAQAGLLGDSPHPGTAVRTDRAAEPFSRGSGRSRGRTAARRASPPRSGAASRS
jgi:GTP-binding protein Era